MNDRVLFLDLETTGLDPKFCSILEVAAVVVDNRLTQHATYEAVVFHDAAQIDAEMNQWCLDTHTKSGLLQEVERSPFDLKSVDERLAQFIKTNFEDRQKVELAGNSVHFDLAFIKHHMPRTAALLSHHLEDVSGMARILRRHCGIDVPKPVGTVQHRAMADVQYSIEQVRLTRETIATIRAASLAIGGRR